MTPSKYMIMLAISIQTSLFVGSAAADETATEVDLAELASRQQQILAVLDDRMRAGVDALIEEEGEALSARTTALLWQQAQLHETREDEAPLPAKREFTDDDATTRVEPARTTACTMVGSTLECTLQERTAP